MLFYPASAPFAEFWLNPFRAAAAKFAVEAISAPVHDVSELDSVVATQARDANSGLIAMPNNFLITYRMEITGPRSAVTSRKCSQRWPRGLRVSPEAPDGCPFVW